MGTKLRSSFAAQVVFLAAHDTFLILGPYWFAKGVLLCAPLLWSR